MNNKAQELSDSQLDAISGGCYYPKPDYCEPKPDHCKPKPYDCHPKKDCYESPWDRWCDKVQDYFEHHKKYC